MYPDRDFSDTIIPVTYGKFGHFMLAGDHWSMTQQDLNNIDYSTMQVEIVQYFLQHKIVVRSHITNEAIVENHLFAKVKWKVGISLISQFQRNHCRLN